LSRDGCKSAQQGQIQITIADGKSSFHGISPGEPQAFEEVVPMRAILKTNTGGLIARKLQIAIVAFPIVASPLFAVPASAASTNRSAAENNNGIVCAIKSPKLPSIDLCKIPTPNRPSPTYI
jgi:hypothetical protein